MTFSCQCCWKLYVIVQSRRRHSVDKSGSTVLYKLYAAVTEDMLHPCGCAEPMSHIISACVLRTSSESMQCSSSYIMSACESYHQLPGGCAVPMSHIISACVLHNLRACSNSSSYIMSVRESYHQLPGGCAVFVSHITRTLSHFIST